MALENYECMFVLDSGRYAQDPQGTENALLELLAKYDAEIVGSTPWQDGKLAYEMDGHRKGLHYLVYFRMDGSHVEAFNRACKLSEIVIRQLLLTHEDKLFDLMTQQVAPNSDTEDDDEPEETVAVGADDDEDDDDED